MFAGSLIERLGCLIEQFFDVAGVETLLACATLRYRQLEILQLYRSLQLPQDSELCRLSDQPRERPSLDRMCLQTECFTREFHE